MWSSCLTLQKYHHHYNLARDPAHCRPTWSCGTGDRRHLCTQDSGVWDEWFLGIAQLVTERCQEHCTSIPGDAHREVATILAFQRSVCGTSEGQAGHCGRFSDRFRSMSSPVTEKECKHHRIKAPVTQNSTSKSRTRSYENLVDVVVSGNLWSSLAWPCFVIGYGRWRLFHGWSTAWALPKNCLSREKYICQWWAAKHTLFPVIPTQNTRPMTVLCPWQIPKLSRLTASPQVLMTAGTRIITCVSRVLHVFTTCATRSCPLAKILSSSELFATSDAVLIFPCVLPRL